MELYCRIFVVYFLWGFWGGSVLLCLLFRWGFFCGVFWFWGLFWVYFWFFDLHNVIMHFTTILLKKAIGVNGQTKELQLVKL